MRWGRVVWVEEKLGYLLLTTDYWLLTTDYWLLITDYWLLTTDYLLPTTQGTTPAFLAVQNGHLSVSRIFKQRPSDEFTAATANATPILQSAAVGDLGALRAAGDLVKATR